MDARKLAGERGLNPDRWADVRDVLPLMEDPNVYRDLPNGRANGREAQDYVRRIRDFADILEKRFPPDADGVTDA
jgi:membrane-bound lytic murein transglycosylase F